jgi:hypothetical protein
VEPTLVSVSHSLYYNNIGAEGAKALGTACRDELTVYLDGNLHQVCEAQRNKTRLIRQFGATPLNRFRLYLCGFGGLFVLAWGCSPECVHSCFFLTSIYGFQPWARQRLASRWSEGPWQRCSPARRSETSRTSASGREAWRFGPSASRATRTPTSPCGTMPARSR